MLTVGVTGGVASGKSTVVAHLASWGAQHTDADEIAHSLTAAGGEAVAAVLEAFGDRVRDDSDGIDRAALGRIVFASSEARARLEALLHPRIREVVERRRERALRAGKSSLFLVEAALLVEAGRSDAYDQLLVVEAPSRVKLQRQIEARHLTPEEGEARLAAQRAAGDKLLEADVIAWNDTTPETLRERCREIWRYFTGVARERAGG